MRRLLPALIAVVLIALPAGSASAASQRPLVGIGDQHLQMFGDKRFQKLHLQVTRLALP
jgi:hypothetical protein